MKALFRFIKVILNIVSILVAAIAAIYWFELDSKFIKWFEPTFRKIVEKHREGE